MTQDERFLAMLKIAPCTIEEPPAHRGCVERWLAERTAREAAERAAIRWCRQAGEQHERAQVWQDLAMALLKKQGRRR